MFRSKSANTLFDFCGLNFAKIFNFGNIANTYEPAIMDQAVSSSHYAETL